MKTEQQHHKRWQVNRLGYKLSGDNLIEKVTKSTDSVTDKSIGYKSIESVKSQSNRLQSQPFRRFLISK